MRFDLKNLLLITTVWKGMVLLVILAGAFLFPFNVGNYSVNFLDHPGCPPDLSSHFETWDAQIYIHLARVGYSQGGFDDAFYPLFPILIRAGAWMTGGHFLAAALVLSTFFTLGAMGLLFRIGTPRIGERAAFGGCLFLLSCPLGFYLGLAYTESLFLFLVLLIVWGAGERKIWPMALGAFLAPLCRPTGLLLALPLSVEAWRKKDRVSFLTFGAWALGTALYLGLMDHWTGSPWSGFEAQKFSVGHFSAANLIHPLDWFFHHFIQVSFSWMEPGTALLDRIYFVLFLVSLWVSWKGLSVWERVYCLALGLIPALSGDLMSYGRYLLALFPLFMDLAKRWQGKEWAYWGVGALLQVFFILRHSLDGFVA